MSNYSDLHTLRAWNLKPLRVQETSSSVDNALVADFGICSDGTDTILRLPPDVVRGSLEWKRAEAVAEDYDLVVGYAYFAADFSASEEPIFDPDILPCQREGDSRLYNGHLIPKI